MSASTNIERKGDFLIIKNTDGLKIAEHISNIHVGMLDKEIFIRIDNTSKALNVGVPPGCKIDEFFDQIMAVVSGTTVTCCEDGCGRAAWGDSPYCKEHFE
jgi:hypothetical protein